MRFTLALALAVALGWVCPARADLGAPGRERAFLSLGPSVEFGIDGRFRFGGDVSLTEYRGRLGLGGAFGVVTPGRIYGELQPVLVLGGQGERAWNYRVRNVLVGLNPGLVVDVTGHTPHYGAQATLWANFVPTEGRRITFASPVVPFVRGQWLPGFDASLTFGVTVKLALDVH